MLKLVTRSSDTLAVSLEEMTEHLRRTDTDEDNALIERLIKASTSWVENFTGLALVDQTWDYYIDDFPASTVDYIKIPKPPLIEIVESYYRDGSEVEFTDYYVDYASHPARLFLAESGTWPETDGARNGVRIRFRAGYVDTGDSPAASGEIPEDIKAAIMIYAATMYENRESLVTGTIVTKIPWGAEDLLRMYRVETSLA